MLKKKTFTRQAVMMIIAFMSVICFMALPVSALEAFEINAYDIKMTVRDDNSYDITETIDVAFSMQRHGIYRTIPMYTYYGRSVAIKDVKVPSHNYSVSTSGGEMTVKIGDASKFADENEKYVITYRYIIGDDRNSEMDELYFNLIGTEWDTNIDNVSFEISMPFEFDESAISFTYGRYGSLSKDAVEYTVDGTVIKGRLNGRLSPYSALTIAIPLPQGYYVNAKIRLEPGEVIEKYFFMIIAGLFALAAIIWLRYGKDKAIFPPVEFYPPHGLTPADIGYIIDGKVDPHDITSLIIYWADKGYLTITETEKKNVFSKRNFILARTVDELPPSARNYEMEMFNKLFVTHGNGKMVTTEQLRNNFYNTVNRVRSMILSRYQHKNEQIYRISGEIASFGVKLLAYAAAVISMFSLYNRMESDPVSTSVVISLIMAAFVAVPMGMLADMMFQWKTIVPGKKLLTVIKRVLISLIVLFGILAMSAGYGNFQFVIIGIAACFFLMLISMYCRKRTELGDKYMEKILGLRSFLISAERDRINALVEENPRYFYDVLPFAMVLGVTDKWARNFEHITLEPPEWYRSNNPYRFYSSVAFVSVLNSSMSTLQTSMTSSPASTGSGGSFGGGSSGGGSGGGGGGSW
ncbi:MAG: DUF2207 domain-containing protein [Eubacteriales bacterium]|nr:DUF2207 domain-containing protein [Eubacteriales bacterium]